MIVHAQFTLGHHANKLIQGSIYWEREGGRGREGSFPPKVTSFPSKNVSIAISCNYYSTCTSINTLRHAVAITHTHEVLMAAD